MMPILLPKERSRIYGRHPFRTNPQGKTYLAKRLKGNIQPKIYDVVNAIRLYKALLKDLEKHDKEAKFTESRELLELIHNIVEGPMAALLQAAQEAHLSEPLSTEMREIRSNLESRIKELRKDFQLNCTHYLTLLSPLELVMRIIAQSVQPQDLEKYKQELSTLYVTNESKGPIKAKSFANVVASRPRYTAGMPRVIFIGIDKENKDSSPLHIITSSPESWPNFGVIYEWANRARQSQMEDYERAEIEALTGIFYERLEGSYESTNHARWNAIKHFKAGHWAKSFDHESILGTPFNFPECDYRARCYKCRALYSFSLPKATLDKEKKSIGEDDRYPATSCAEVLAHIFCARKTNHTDDGSSVSISVVNQRKINLKRRDILLQLVSRFI